MEPHTVDVPSGQTVCGFDRMEHRKDHRISTQNKTQKRGSPMNINRTPSRIFCTAAIREAAACLGADAGDFSEELYTEFARSGNRIHYEAANFHRRRLLNRLALGELCEGGGRFLPELERIIDCTLNERSWVLPAHSGGKLPQGAETNIDLFSSQTAAALAMISARLPLTDTLQKRIWESIDARIFQPFLAHDYWWRDLGKNRREVPSNWTPWCIHGVLECVRAVAPDALPWCDEDFSWGGFADTKLQRANHPVRLIPSSDGSTFRPETRPQLPLASFLPPGHLLQLTEIAQSCLVSLHNYFEDYPDDGGCDEGAQYWEHSVGHFFECGLWQQFDTAKLCAMYSFISKVHMTGNYYMNFADCAARIFPNASMIFLMGTAGGLPELAGFGAFLHRTCMAAAPDPTLRDNMDFRAILNAALASCAIETYMDMPIYRPDTSMELCTAEPIHRPQDQFASLNAGIFRRKYFCVAAKGGHNAENHNHNDCGNVIVYAGGLPILIDAGVGAYTKDTFSERRYTIWTMQSSYHNLPEINGCMQRDGREYCATSTTFSEDTFFCECHRAYPAEAGLSYFSRSANVGEKFVKLTSKFSFETEENHLALNYMLAEKPELVDCRARVNGCILKLP
ncbi:MAG: heparinase II/III-family protein, partial [Lachnospiraceae bacterium]|nr:heparinase II/III-family protein [Lachnospiraceae bacterium]